MELEKNTAATRTQTGLDTTSMPSETAAPTSSRRGLLRRLAAGAAGLAAAAAYGSARTKPAMADHEGDRVGPAPAGVGLLAYPNGVAPPSLPYKAGLIGVYDAGAASPEAHAGVTGLANNYHAVHGRSNNGLGVWGYSTTWNGVYGTSVTNVAVYADAKANTGVLGLGGSNNIGVKGLSRASVGGLLVGDGTAAGVFGQSGSGPGVDGQSTSGLGVRGTSSTFVGVVGISTSNHGLYGSTSGANAAGLVGENTAGGLAGIFSGSVQVFGSFQVFGAKNAVIKMPDRSNASVYCQESPEPYFEDFGRAQLIGGVANVPLEREFASLVAGGDYMVFPVAEGLSGGLYVSRRGPTSFEVRDPANSNIPISYRIVTRRKDIEGKRFARVSDEGAKSVAATRAALGITGPSPAPPFVPPAPSPAPVPPSNPNAPNPAPERPRGAQDGPR